MQQKNTNHNQTENRFMNCLEKGVDNIPSKQILILKNLNVRVGNDINPWIKRFSETKYNINGEIFLFIILWHYSPMLPFASTMDLLQTLGPRLHFWFPNRQFFFTGRGCQPHAQPPSWRIRSHGWVTVGLLFNPGRHMGYKWRISCIFSYKQQVKNRK